MYTNCKYKNKYDVIMNVECIKITITLVYIWKNNR